MRSRVCPDQLAAGGTRRAMAQMKPASSRAIAAVTTLAGLPLRPPIRLHPVARSLWDRRWCHHNAVVPARRQVTLDAIAARVCFVTNPEPDALAAKLAHQAIQGRWRVGNPTIFPDLTA
jgi:hypothetical protein